MTLSRHGLSIGMERLNSDFLLTLKAVGKLNHDDYDTIVPVIESALEGVTSPKMRVYIDASEFEGWELRAAWDDFRLGLKHGNEMTKVAIFGHKKWQERTAKIASWFASGEIRFFNDEDDALAWLSD